MKFGDFLFLAPFLALFVYVCQSAVNALHFRFVQRLIMHKIVSVIVNCGCRRRSRVSRDGLLDPRESQFALDVGNFMVARQAQDLAFIDFCANGIDIDAVVDHLENTVVLVKHIYMIVMVSLVFVQLDALADSALHGSICLDLLPKDPAGFGVGRPAWIAKIDRDARERILLPYPHRVCLNGRDDFPAIAAGFGACFSQSRGVRFNVHASIHQELDWRYFVEERFAHVGGDRQRFA